MVASATQPAPLSYAERARRAQNIKSPIAAPPPSQTVLIHQHPPPAPPPTVLGGDNTSTTTTTSSNSTAPSISVSTSISASTDDTPNSSIILATRASSPIPQTSFSSSRKEQSVLRSSPSQGAKSAETDSGAKTRSSPSSQLATKALSIVAAHTAPGGAVVGKSTPTVNVWSQRIAARASVAPSVSSKSLNSGLAATGAAASPPGPKTGNGKPTAHQIATSRSAGKDADASLLQPVIPQQQLPSSADDTAIPPSVTSAAQSISTSISTSTPSAPSASTSISGVGSVGASSRNPIVSVEALPTQPAAARELVSADIWPEVGKAVLTVSSSTSGDSLRPSVSATESVRTNDVEVDDDERDGNKGSKTKSKNKSKSKWVPIPAAELQAAADAANAARKPSAGPSGQRKGGRGNGNSHSNSHNTNPNSSHGNTSANNTPRSHSGRTSAAQSRSQSAQNSPRVTRGRRLPLEEASNGIAVADVAAVSTAVKPQGSEPLQLLPNQYPHPTQSQYAPYLPPAGQAPYNADPISAYLQVNVQRPHRHQHQNQQPQHHGIQPVNPPSPSTHAFQASAAPFYPQTRMPPPQIADASSSSVPPLQPPPPPQQQQQQPSGPPPPGVFPPRAAYPPQGAHGPPMYPVYVPPGYAYGGWPGPGPAYVYGPSPPPPSLHQHQHQPTVYESQQFIDAQAPASVSVPHPPPEVPVLHVEVDVSGANGSGSGNRSGEPVVREGEETTKGEVTPSPSAVALRDKMMFGSIDSTASLLETLELSPSSANGNVVGGGGGVNGGPTLIGSDVEKAAADDGKLKVKRTRSANGSAKDGVAGGRQSVGKALLSLSPHGPLVVDAPGGVIPAVQASQSVQAENKWKFGTTNSTPPVQREQALPLVVGGEHIAQQQQQRGVESALMHASSTMPAIAGAQVGAGNLSPFTVALDPRGSTSFAHLAPPQQSATAALSQPPPHEMGLGLVDSNVIQPAEGDSDLEVKDYGYGFGDASGSGYAPALAREERLVREREFEAAREREITMWREENRKGFQGMPGSIDDGRVGLVHEVVVGPGEGEAGPSHGGYGHLREHGYGRGGAHGAEGSGLAHTNGRGGGRRGAGGGAYGSGGRGYGGSERGGGYGGRRGRGMNGYSNSRGYRNGYLRGAGVPHRAPPFTVTPPQHSMPLSPMNEHQAIPAPGYYPPPRQLASYLPPLPGVNGFEAYPPLPPSLPPANGATGSHNSPPVPAPLSSINFPLDPTRYFLLGQLEYYLSPQNMAQDFYLRQQMDSRGWIPISLIASFNRVKQLTMDAQLVRDVLTLSSIVQVRGPMVRMGGWEQFVLPDAAPSPVEEHPMQHTYPDMGTYHDGLAVERHHQLLHQQNYQSQYQPQHDVGSNANVPWRVDQQQAGEGLPLVNGHLDNKAADTSTQDEEDDEDEEEDVVFVMGHESGSWSPERGA